MFKLKLYVVRHTKNSRDAISNLRNIISDQLKDQYELEVIDVIEKPQLAEDEKILATPTLLKKLPKPVRRIIGDMSDSEKVLLGLDIEPYLSPKAEEEKKNES